jgi:class 3 adenylate cyclase
MQQVADWLQKLGLGQYAQTFAENDIDFSVLPYLTDADLEKIGVSLGHRRKILAAIAELPGASLSNRKVEGIVEPKPQDTAERRQVTVMFSDLVGFTALSARMDPEDLREIADTVQRFDGFVAKYMGDGVLVYFGYPQAQRTARSASSSWQGWRSSTRSAGSAPPNRQVADNDESAGDAQPHV